MKRSQSAPQPLPALVKKPILPRSSSHIHLQQNVKREIKIQTPTSPSVEREDPFSLGGFFPSSKNSESEEWMWLREDSKAEYRESIVLDESVSLSDQEVQELIEREDKMGVLALSLEKYIKLLGM